MSYGKWISGAIGWALGGPIGAIFGFALASFFETGSSVEKRPYSSKRIFSQTEERNSFLVSLLVFSSAVMKADGKVMRSELDYVREFLKKNFGPDAALEATKYLRDLLEKEVDINRVGEQVSRYMTYEARIQLLHYLTGIAKADGVVSYAELAVLREIAQALAIPLNESNAVFAMFDNGIEAAYQILEVPVDATESQIKKAYKYLAVKHHPDKVAHLGADVQRASEERFKKIAEAYEKVKRERGI
ncbi:MAG: TerB family tellurite resistance protein [Bacteroidales bacterium]